MELNPAKINTAFELHDDRDGFENVPEEKVFSEEELENIGGLCEVLQGIRTRLISEGFSISELREKFYAQKSGILK